MPWNKIGDLNRESILVSLISISIIMFSANKNFKLTHWDVAPFKIMSALTTINNQLSRQFAVGSLSKR